VLRGQFWRLWALRKAVKAMCSLIGANHVFMLPHGELFINGSLQIKTAPPQHSIFTGLALALIQSHKLRLLL
tara:strand:- start:830 stop:1045 length:216 start_codon:yes stop_codon:yes gene_type:complete